MIAGYCQPLGPEAGFFQRMADFVDCQAQAIGAGGYQALAAPGSGFSLLLTAALTLFVALYGYRMLFGQVPNIREAVLAIVKIGFVLALAASWPTYRTLVYDFALRGPAELAAQIGGGTAIPGSAGGLVPRLQYQDWAFSSLAVAGVGDTVTGVAAAPQAAPIAPPLAPGFDTLALGGARLVFLMSSLGSLAAVRLVAGLLLALGPLFILFALFGATRGLFEGWVRGLVGSVLGAVGVAILLGVELALLEPWITDLLARRAAGIAIPGAPTELLAASLIFGFALLAVLFAAARVASGFRLPAWMGATASSERSLVRRDGMVIATAQGDRSAAPNEGRSRAAALVDAVSAGQRREVAAATRMAEANRGAAVPALAAARGDSGLGVRQVPIGESFRRRTRSRMSASAARRDGRR